MSREEKLLERLRDFQRDQGWEFDELCRLLQRLVARDEQALVELVDLATPWLLSVVQAMLQDRDEAEEVVMHTFRIVWENVTLETGGNAGLMPYLLRVARHRFARARVCIAIIIVVAAIRCCVFRYQNITARQCGYHKFYFVTSCI